MHKNVKEKKIALIFGNEVKGVSQEGLENAEHFIQIDQYGVKKSMNVSVTAGIVLWSITNTQIRKWYWLLWLTDLCQNLFYNKLNPPIKWFEIFCLI